MKFCLLTLTPNHVLGLASLKTNLRKKKRTTTTTTTTTKKQRNNNNSSEHQQKMNHRLQRVAEDYQPGDPLKEGTQIFILSSVQQKA